MTSSGSAALRAGGVRDGRPACGAYCGQDSVDVATLFDEGDCSGGQSGVAKTALCTLMATTAQRGLRLNERTNARPVAVSGIRMSTKGHRGVGGVSHAVGGGGIPGFGDDQ